MPWERRQPAPWERNTPIESSDDEDAKGTYTTAYDYETTTTVRDDYWDSLNNAPSTAYSGALGGAASLDTGGSVGGGYAAVATTASSYEYAKSYDPYTTPDSEEDVAAAAMVDNPRGVGVVQHEFEAEGDEELTVDVGDKVRVVGS